jgi:rRNA-processing protein FCF1
MKRVILDTSMLCAIFDYKVDVLTEIRSLFHDSVKFVVPQAVLDELHLLKTKKGKSGRAASLALSVLARVDYERVPLKGKADEVIAQIVQPGDALASFDKQLIHRVKREKPAVFIITIKKKKVVELM